jgi:NADH:ubiquinone oxidoreductase subunit 6 (subunit J)
MLGRALAELVDLESGIAATVYGLTTRPGTVVRDYWAQRTRLYVSPVRYFLFAIAVFQVVLWQTGAARSMVRGFLEGAAGPDAERLATAAQARALEVFGDYFLVFFVVGVLVLAAVSWLGSSRNAAEELILHLYVWAHLTLLWSLAATAGHVVSLAGPWAAAYEGAVLVVTALYYVWADVAAHRPDRQRRLGRDIAEAVGSLFLSVVTYVMLVAGVAGVLAGFGTGG